MKYCKNCGKELEENSEFCIECGVKIVEGNEQVKSSNGVGFSIASFVLGITSLVLSIIFSSIMLSYSKVSFINGGYRSIKYAFYTFIPTICSILGIVFGAIGISKKNNNKKFILALIGLIVSVITFFLCFSSCASCLQR